MKTIIISLIIAFVTIISISVPCFAKTVRSEQALDVSDGSAEFTMEISDTGALKYDFTTDIPEGDIIVLNPEGRPADQVHFTSADMPVHRYVPVSGGTYTIKVTRSDTPERNSAITGYSSFSLEYEPDTERLFIFDLVDSVKAIIITITGAIFSVIIFLARLRIFPRRFHSTPMRYYSRRD
ncbi:MAG: hypothetical protein J6M07_10715 [Ruminococcus sp.]|nr:hypothetical protein [Ruminococcus sp.]MBQ5316672.1 hypothetical protein [Oscillospiraceae bacterium]